MKQITRETRWYDYDETYEIMITKEESWFEATIFKKHYGINTTMFLIPCTSWEKMEEVVEKTAEEYINTLEWTIDIIEKAS